MPEQHEWKAEISKRLAGLELDPAREAEIAEEISQHLEDRYKELIAGGVNSEEAVRVAMQDLVAGNHLVEELMRIEHEAKPAVTVLGGGVSRNPFADLWQDLLFGLRQLRRNPSFTAAAVCTLALAIGMNATIFSAVSLVLLKRPPGHDPDRLMIVASNNRAKGWNLLRVSAPNFESFRRENNVFEGMAAAHTGEDFTLTGAGAPEHLTGMEVTADYFKVLGISPAMGRGFLPGENQAARDRVVILSHALWKQHFGSDRAVLGRQIHINDELYTVIGVMPPGAEMAFTQPELWTPIVFIPKD
ncbi:MAG: ABC transporter permease [Acidobacteriota bacterium]|nr:ABC transporter permease [Acidobacteriota bacterium]